MDARRRSLLVDKAHNALPLVALRVVPDAGTLRRDARLGADARGLREKEPGAAGGQRASIHEVPVVGHPVVIEAHVLTHGGYPQAITERDSPDGEGFKKLGHGSP